MDWNQIKAEYISGGTSYRKLCQKYDINYRTLQKRATDEDWVGLKNQAIAKSESKMVNSVAKDIAKKSIKIDTVADKLLDKISDLLDTFELDTQAIKHLTSSLKDIKDIKGLKSDIDLREQEARINKLRKDAEEEQKDTEFKINICGGEPSWQE